MHAGLTWQQGRVKIAAQNQDAGRRMALLQFWTFDLKGTNIVTNEDAMYGAIARGDTDTVRELVANDPSVLKIYVVEKNWLHWAAQDGRPDIMEVLVNAGLSIDQLTSDGTSTPLEIAAGQGQYRACEWLLDHGADINRGLGQSATPIFSAIYSKSLDLVELFVARGANLGATFGDPKIDPISFATVHGTPAILNFLENVKDRHGSWSIVAWLK
jgi:ankyrin repeat protein